MAKVEIYTTTICPYCRAAKELLGKKGAAYDEISLTDQRDQREHPARADAMATLIGRGEATVDDYVERARALSADSARLREAAAVLKVAIDKAPERHELLLERAVIIAQTQDFAEGAELLRAYLEVAPKDAPKRKMAEERLKVLEAKIGAAPGEATDAKAPEGKAPNGKAPKPAAG